ncbi:hypothetical protein BDQ17DRAFT_1323936 [Cyathus striatus]|nr:hypothetical protein BDQ17DRAFT_1323936 [Cyathus striatus]
MLIHFLIYIIFGNTSLEPAYSSPILNATSSSYTLPVSLVALNATTFDSAPLCNCNQRSALDITWSCLSTLFLCTWVSIHPNTPAPSDEGWRVLWRRLKTIYWAIIVPEMVTFWALQQYSGARALWKQYDLHGHYWTIKHAHFLQMGGFHLRNGDHTTVIYPGQFQELLNDGIISFPNVSKAVIQDKSKADGLSKFIVVAQTLWFVIQCIARHAQGLPLAQLEVTTLAIIAYTFMLSLIWWHKPFNVAQPLYLDKAIASADPDTKIKQINAVEENKISVIGDEHEYLLAATDHDNIDVVASEEAINNGKNGDVADSTTASLLLNDKHGQQNDAGIELSRLNGINNHSEGLELPLVSTDHAFEVKDDIANSTLIPNPSELHVENDVCGSSGCQKKHNRFFWKLFAPVERLFSTPLLIFRTIRDEVVKSVHEDDYWFFVITVGWTIWYPLYEMLGADDEEKLDKERVGSYFSFDPDDEEPVLKPQHVIEFVTFIIFTSIFGLVHIFAWNSDFPSTIEVTLWRISSVVVSTCPVIVLVILTITFIMNRLNRKFLGGIHWYLFVSALFIMGVALPLFYGAARYYLLVEAFIAFKSLPPSAFETVAWLNFLPHI